MLEIINFIFNLKKKKKKKKKERENEDWNTLEAFGGEHSSERVL